MERKFNFSRVCFYIKTSFLIVFVGFCMHSGLNQPSVDDKTWKAPDDGWIKLNLHVCMDKNGDQIQAACGGVFRNSQGFWQFGYIVKQSPDLNPSSGIGPSRIEVADLWTLLMGLQLARNASMEKLCVESESVALIGLLANACPPNYYGTEVTEQVNRVKGLMDRGEWQVELEPDPISEKANRLARSVALYGLGLPMVQGVEVLQDIPVMCIDALGSDIMDLPF